MNKDKEEKIIFESSPEAASIQTITGWVSRDGRFWGNRPDSEAIARYAGATHKVCKCGEIIVINGYCHICYAKKEIEKYNSMERQEWNGKDGLHSQAFDEYCWDADDIDMLCEEEECIVDELRLIICEPVYAREIEPDEYYADNLPEDGETPDALQKFFNELNEQIREAKIILSWYPGKYAAIIKNNI